ncbi:hypothetical protein AAZX31_12G208500 [Glycine max]|nr:hypothetical protein GLYMA_12G220101v4 [Glycine max]KAG4386084.1 hypothetical protein GLYMA_12G220101v4 [Glycine max]KAH1144374.1 hypothetical protein GYH30_034552 [Glycine max]KAH1144565.1 hypothetical protein GYH30_034679 [Glycine max]KAH1144566.1 hypothetical protein GYH30_034679 [Glycine max]
MAAWTVAARRATNMVQLSSQTTSSLLHRRGLAGAAVRDCFLDWIGCTPL